MRTPGFQKRRDFNYESLVHINVCSLTADIRIYMTYQHALEATLLTTSRHAKTLQDELDEQRRYGRTAIKMLVGHMIAMKTASKSRMKKR